MDFRFGDCWNNNSILYRNHKISFDVNQTHFILYNLYWKKLPTPPPPNVYLSISGISNISKFHIPLESHTWLSKRQFDIILTKKKYKKIKKPHAHTKPHNSPAQMHTNNAVLERPSSQMSYLDHFLKESGSTTNTTHTTSSTIAINMVSVVDMNLTRAQH